MTTLKGKDLSRTLRDSLTLSIVESTTGIAMLNNRRPGIWPMISPATRDIRNRQSRLGSETGGSLGCSIVAVGSSSLRERHPVANLVPD